MAPQDCNKAQHLLHKAKVLCVYSQKNEDGCNDGDETTKASVFSLFSVPLLGNREELPQIKNLRLPARSKTIVKLF
jgi:hypothetical protein